MADLTIVGSGAAGVHAARIALQSGHRVTLVDVGYAGSPAPLPQEPLNGLKRNLPDPVDYLLGPTYSAVIPPDAGKEYYGIPPSKDYVFRAPAEMDYSATGFFPLFSYARGGLAEAWTGGAYEFSADEITSFPFPISELEPFYAEVVEQIGITGAADDLAPHYPSSGRYQESLPLDEHSALLMNRYLEKRQSLKRKFGCVMGRSRVAVLSRDLDGRKACDRTGRCMWGCPGGSLYTPSLTLDRLAGNPSFTYLPGRLVTHFRWEEPGRRITALHMRNLDTGKAEELPCRHLILAAGTLSSIQIFLSSIRRATGQQVRLPGLMDNRQILMPFVSLGMIGHPFASESYQYHQLALAIPGDRPGELVHSQITALKTALFHPVLQSMPLDYRTSLYVGRALHAALGVINLNFSDSRRTGNTVWVEEGKDGGPDRLAMSYAPPAGEKAKVKRTMGQVAAILRHLGAIVPPTMSHVRPMGASVHYAGLLPMSRDGGELTTTPGGFSRDFPNLGFADGSTLPALPAKNLTLTLMALASRLVARADFS
ncbi:MAG TPA: hypothetical protein PKK12_02945 [Candidatus Aminicenantes bacterium]|nr:hypothetical protein [Candidatus Aminicenantes bacterium]